MNGGPMTAGRDVRLLDTLCAVLWGMLVLWSGLFGGAALAQPVGYMETGLASIYANAHDGDLTASGEIYDKTKLTAAHKTLPFGTRVKVTNPKNDKSVILLINDRGPVQPARILDISPVAASRLGLRARGVHEVTLEVVEIGSGKTTRPEDH